MITPSAIPPTVPDAVKRARWFLAIQAVPSCAGAVFLLVAAAESGQDDAGILAGIGLLLLTLSGFLAYAVYRLGRPYPRALRAALVFIEVLYVALAVWMLFTGAGFALGGLFAVVVLVSLLGSNGSSWISD
ncbi:hypothetical protein [Streptomyces sp. NPDC047974]|uniref:hypothetical protein n=1 Tax=Streptomyces sp. NPDC047974 TaxID=3154343 RepID=UPI0033C6BA98